jgi:SHS2 domain-containing protein
MKYKFLEHRGDIKFQAYGKKLNEAFGNVAEAISSILSRDEKIPSKIKKKIEVEGTDQKSLLYNFIEELIYLLDAENFVVSKAKVAIVKNKLSAVVYGDSVDNHPDLDHIKAATYAEMRIKKTNKGYEIQTVVDV